MAFGNASDCSLSTQKKQVKPVTDTRGTMTELSLEKRIFDSRSYYSEEINHVLGKET